MSVLIPDMEMPEECFYCPLRDSCEHSINLSHRPSDCPLISVVEQKTGKWTEDSISWPTDKWVIYGFKCSECGRISSFNSSYCPNCGARMVDE